MDVSDACNLACRDCYTKQSHGRTLVGGDRFEQVLTKLADPRFALQKLHLNWRGEPTTNKRLPELLRIRRDILPDVQLEFHTNGMLLTESKCDELLAAMMPGDLLYVSIDGGFAEAHEANRGAGTWRPALDGLIRLLDVRDRMGGETAEIGIYEIFYGRGRYDPELLALGRRADYWTRVDPVEPGGRELSLEAGGIPRGPCFWAGHSLCVTATSDVHVCLLSFQPAGRLGNLIVDDLETIVGRARAFRKRLLETGRENVPHCRTCLKAEGDVDDE